MRIPYIMPCACVRVCACVCVRVVCVCVCVCVCVLCVCVNSTTAVSCCAPATRRLCEGPRNIHIP
jgi:hypothetical protein